MNYPTYDYTFESYQNEVRRTMAGHSEPEDVQLAIFTLGLAGESGEVADLVKKWIGHGKPRDFVALQKELGDILWYIGAVADKCGLNLESIAKTNIDKLDARYPNGFNHVDANKRRDVEENEE